MNISLDRVGPRGPRGPRCPRGRAGLVAAVLLLAVGASACGSQADASPEVASLGTDAPAASTPDASTPADAGTDDTATDDTATDDTATDGTATDDTTPVDPEDAMLEYAQCMRDHGIDMPDPQVNGSGNDVIVIAGTESGGAGPSETPGTGVPALDPAWEAAQEACQPIMDAVASDVEIDPEVLAEQREQMLDFAQCMREHGVDMPDPVFDDNGGISIQVGDPSGSDGPAPDDDTWTEANAACSEILGLPGDGGFSVTPAGADGTSIGVVNPGNGGEG